MVAAPKPNLVGTVRSIAQNVSARFSGLLPDLVPEYGSVIYLPQATYYMKTTDVSGGPYANITPGSTVQTGVWTCPAGITSVQVECWGGGGGGGGGGVVNGSIDQGGSGGGGGEYAQEPNYPVVPGNTYAFTIDTGGAGGVAGQPGVAGNQTVFDTQSVGLPGGVVANGGSGGDVTKIGIGGAGGTGSTNTLHYSGGAGGSPGNGTSGLDNPNLYAGAGGVNWGTAGFWWPLYDASGTTSVADLSGNGNVGASFDVTTGNTSPAAPGEVQNATGSANDAYFAGPSVLSNINAPVLIPNSVTGLTFACWVNLDNLGYGGQNPRLIATDWPYHTKFGADLYIQGSGSSESKVVFQMGNGSSLFSITSSSALSSIGNAWHFIVATWVSGTMTLYIDGASAATGTGPTGYHGQASTSGPPGIGYNGEYNGDYFTGYMSNVWVMEAAVTLANVQASYGAGAPPTGGSGGGGSAGSGSNGTVGSLATGSASGAGGAGGSVSSFPANGGGTGGAGGASGASGGQGEATPNQPVGTAGSLATGSGTGGGGGGAGYATVATTTTTTFQPAQSGTFAGSDATGGQAGTLLNSSPSNGAITQGGQVASNGALNGTQTGMLILPTGLSALLEGATIHKVTLQFQTIFGANRTCLLGYTNSTSLPSSIPAPTAIKSFQVGKNNNQNYTYDLSSVSAFKTALTNGTATALTFGNGTAGTTGLYNSGSAASYYMQIAGAGNANNNNGTAPVLTINYTTSGGAVGGGAGAPGSICITYTTPSNVPVCSYLDTTTQDTAGNQFAAGFTGQITAFNPVLSSGLYNPEIWHTLNTPSGMTGTIRCGILPISITTAVGTAAANFLCLDINVVITTPATTGNSYTSSTMPSAAYYPTVSRSFPLMTQRALSTSTINLPYVAIPTSGNIVINMCAFASTSNSSAVSATVLCPLN